VNEDEDDAVAVDDVTDALTTTTTANHRSTVARIVE